VVEVGVGVRGGGLRGGKEWYRGAALQLIRLMEALRDGAKQWGHYAVLFCNGVIKSGIRSNGGCVVVVQFGSKWIRHHSSLITHHSSVITHHSSVTVTVTTHRWC
jgi:hypothetical protein